MFLVRWLFVTSTVVLVSCGPSSKQGVQGAFRTPLPGGGIETSLVETQSATIDGTISLVAGRQEGAGLRAYAGIIPGQPMQQPLAGEATFEGPYAVAFIENIVIEDNFVRGRNSILDGTITLSTDLSEMTLFGTDEALTVRARIIENTQIVGEVEILGVPGVLEGEIGEDRTFGAFHGGDLTHLISGGFVATRQP